MAAKVGVKPEEYAAAMPGTYFLSLDEAQEALRRRATGSTRSTARAKIADDFNVANKVYAQAQPVDELHRRDADRRQL